MVIFLWPLAKTTCFDTSRRAMVTLGGKVQGSVVLGAMPLLLCVGACNSRANGDGGAAGASPAPTMSFAPGSGPVASASSGECKPLPENEHPSEPVEILVKPQ